MACTTCSQEFNNLSRKPTCPSCAAAILYSPRVQQIGLLVDRDNSHSHAEAILRPGNDGVIAALQDADWDTISSGIKKESLLRVKDDLATASERLDKLRHKVEALRGEVLRYRDHVASNTYHSRKAELQQRKDRLVEHRANADDTAIRKTNQKLQRLHHRSADARAQLCARAAILAGLKQRRADRVSLGGIDVPNLRELGALPPQGPDAEEMQVQMNNASLGNATRLLSIWTHYLSTSPPAELLMPHSDFPYPVILTEKSSYKNDMTGSQLPSRVRPRPLHLDRPLSKLVKEDPKAFALYVEGVMLLAWNLAWVCKTQGIPITTFEEVCDLGRNLWLLYRAAESRTPNAAFGVLTHGTVLHSLTGYEGALVLHNWRLQPHQLTDQLRSFLLVELTGREWDVLSEHDYDDERADEMPILVGGTRRKRDNATALSVMSIGGTEDPGKDRGWMKVRGRPSE